jgi:hypothetical protein
MVMGLWAKATEMSFSFVTVALVTVRLPLEVLKWVFVLSSRSASFNLMLDVTARLSLAFTLT